MRSRGGGEERGRREGWRAMGVDDRVGVGVNEGVGLGVNVWVGVGVGMRECTRVWVWMRV